MNDRNETDRRLARWFAEEAAGRAPERLVHETRERVAATRQIGRVSTLRLRLSTVFPGTGIRAAAVLTIAVVLVASAVFLGMGSRPNPGSGSRPATPRPSLTSLAPYACPDAGAGPCLGPLPAGAFETHAFLPWLGYVVPAGWTNTLDTRGQFDLSYGAGGAYTYPDEIGFHDGISFFRRPVAESSTSRTPLAGIGKTALDLARWLDGHVDLDSSGLTPVTVGGAPGYRITIAVPKGPRTTQITARPTTVSRPAKACSSATTHSPRSDSGWLVRRAPSSTSSTPLQGTRSWS